MSSWFLSLVAIAVIAWSLVAGFRIGSVRQVPRVIGLVLGAVCAHVFHIPAINAVMDAFPYAVGRTETLYIYSTIGCGLVFVAVYFVFCFATSVVVYPFRKQEPGMLGRLGGAVISLVVYLTFLSLSYNVLVCLSPRSDLMNSMRSSDGNILEEVLMVAPVMLGTQTPEELSHRQQLEDAKRISCIPFAGPSTYCYG